MNTHLYKIHLCGSLNCVLVCTAGSTVACLAFTVTFHFNKQPLNEFTAENLSLITGM